MKTNISIYYGLTQSIQKESNYQLFPYHDVTVHQTRISRGIHGFSKVLEGPTMPYHSACPMGGHPINGLMATGWQGGHPAAVLLTLWIPHAIRTCRSPFIMSNLNMKLVFRVSKKKTLSYLVKIKQASAFMASTNRI